MNSATGSKVGTTSAYLLAQFFNIVDLLFQIFSVKIFREMGG